MHRRKFIKICSGALAGCGAAELAGLGDAALADALPDVPHPRVLLTDAQGVPLKASALSQAEAYVFTYPYASTPCFLIRLKQAAQPAAVPGDAGAYDWPGGVGPERSIVAYSAICAHQLAYPSKDSSVIAYDAATSQAAGRPGMIVCCAHQSVYDPAAGARVVGGPAPAPLAAVILEHDPATDTLTATGVVGEALFNRFFKLYRMDLIHAVGAARVQQAAADHTPAVLLSTYSAYVAEC